MATATDLAKGKWSLASSDKFDEYLKALGVGMATRLIVTKLKPDQEFVVEDGKWTLRTLSTFRNVEVSFKPGEECDEKTPDGREVKSLWTLDGSKLIKKETGDVETLTTRDFSQDKFTMTMEAKGVKCTRVYTRKSE